MERPTERSEDLRLFVEGLADDEVELLAETLGILRRGGDVSVLARHDATRRLAAKVAALAATARSGAS